MKTLIFCLAVLLLLAVGCVEHQKPADKKPPQSYEELVGEQLALNSKNDTTFLGFVLGMPEQEAESHFAYLDKSNRTGGDRILEFAGARILGKLYSLQVNDSTECECLLSAQYFEGKLYFLTLLILRCQSQDVLDFLKNTYGQFDIKVEDGTFWLDGNRELEFRTIGGVNALEFRDLRLKQKDLALKKSIDSLGREIGREKAKSDFK